MTINFNKVSIGNIEGGKAVKLINKNIDETVRELFQLSKDHHISAKKLKGQVVIKISIQPLSDLEDHYSISSVVKRQVPEISNHSIALIKDGGLFVQERGSDSDSPLQTTIENFTEEVEEEGQFIKVLGDGTKVDTRSGEITKKA